MHVGEMRVSVGDGLVLMRVRVRLAAVPRERMYVLMVAVVTVQVVMLEKLVGVLVLMMLGEVQPDAIPISTAATQKAVDRGSCSSAMASAAPTKGAVAKYAPARAAPRPRSAST